jgi:predicted transcriptional regulator
MITGEVIRSMRKKMKMTQHQLAKETGFSQAHIAKIERGKVDPRLSTVNKILSVLEKGSDEMCSAIMTKKIISIHPDSTIQEAVEIMGEESVSQLPVIESDKVVGTVYERAIVVNISKGFFDKLISSIMAPPLPIVDGSLPCSQAKGLLEHYPAILVSVKGTVSGIISRSDIFKTIGK